MRSKVLIGLIPMVIVITFIYLAMFLVVQQNYRLSANDPQIQMAEDQANNLNTTQGTGFSYGQNMDIAKTLATFTIVYDSTGKMITEVVANGKAPTLPSGVLTNAKKNGQDRFTWDAAKGVRIAAVVVKFDRGYILVGRSIKEVDKRIGDLAGIVFISWLLTVVVYGFSAAYTERRKA
jgi:hypothetical protein